MAGRTRARPPRIAVLWEAFSDYIRASFAALAEEGAELQLFRRSVMAAAPFDEGLVTKGLRTHTWTGSPDPDAISRALDEFEPDAVLIMSWHLGGYRRVARRLRGRTLRILAMSNPWSATLKQRAGVAISPFVIRPAYDAAILCDERQATFAAKLGFPAERLIWGMNTCDHASFASVAQRGGELPPKRFLFVGRLVPDKAIDVMAAGYARYRQLVAKPWDLIVAGIGPQEHLLRGNEGVEMVGFTQPDKLPELFEQAGCLVLPSRYEPWGVVIHEATAAGLPVVCSRVCGASTRLVLDGYNGVVISPDNPEALATALRRIHEATDDQRLVMGRASELLSLQYTPERWARNLLQRIPDLRREIGLEARPWDGSDQGSDSARSRSSSTGVKTSA